MAKLKFYLNESVNIAVANGLIRRDVEAISAKDVGNLGLSDEEQLTYAIKNNLVIITHDADFLSMAMNFKHKGIVYIHQQKYGIGDLIRKLKLLWEIAELEDMLNHIEFL
jgi:predicted nuclease of predicted toxin-antitoxin system